MRLKDAVGSVLKDLHFAVRGMGRNKAFSATLVLSLAMGIGAVVSVFTVLDAVVFRPLPYEDPEELVRVSVRNEDGSTAGRIFSWETASQVRDAADFLPSLFFSSNEALIRAQEEWVTRTRFNALSPGAFATLGVPVKQGRTFSPDDFAPGAPDVAILSHEYWASEQSGLPDAVGSEIRLSGRPVTVIGIMPESFRFPYIGRPDGWLPIQNDGTVLGSPASGIEIVARTPESQTIEAVSERLVGVSPDVPRLNLTEAKTVVASFFGEYRANTDVMAAFKVLGIAGVVLLLMAVVNSANLLLARRSSRVHELSLRRFLGATSGRITRQLLTENLLSGLLAGVLAVSMVAASTPLLVRLIPEQVLAFSSHAISVEWRVLLFTFGVTALSGFTFGIIPTVGAGRSKSRSGRTDRSEHRLRTVLVIAEIALSVILLVGAGLLSSSFIRLVQVDPGFQPEGLLKAQFELPSLLYPDGASRAEVTRSLRAELLSRPEIEGVLISGSLPPEAEFGFGNQFETAEGRRVPDLDQQFVSLVTAEPQLFDIMEIEITGGRAFLPGETTEDAIVIVDEALAERLWPDQDPIGRRFRRTEQSEWLTVVGTTEDVKLLTLDDSMGQSELYTPLPPDEGTPAYQTVMVRSNTSTDQARRVVLGALQSVGPDLPTPEVQTLDEVLWELIEKPRFLVILVTLFTVIAVVLATVGIFGVLSVSVAQRKRELGIRVALGASSTHVRALVLRHGTRIALFGIGIGLVGSLAGSKVIESVLFDVEPTDPLTLFTMSAFMLVLILLTTYLPARRASRVDPVEVLKSD